MTTPRTPDEPHRALGRREEDKAEHWVVTQMTRVMTHWKILSAAILMTAGIATSVSAWFGAQTSSPGQRVTRLESKVDVGFERMNLRIDTLKARQDSAAAARRDTDDKLDLLLRLGCRQMQQADLVRACDRQRVPR